MGIIVAVMDSTTYAASVAANVRRVIKERGLSVSEVASRASIPRVTLSRRLDGSPFTVSELKSVADVLETTARDLATVEISTGRAVA